MRLILASQHVGVFGSDVMAQGWRILDCINLEGRIRSTRGQVVIESKDGSSQSVPVADVSVVLVGVKVGFSAAVLHRLCDEDVAVLFCDWRGVPEGGAYCWSDHSRVGARHLAQSSVSQPRKKSLWSSIIRAKIKGQSSVLDALGLPHAARLQMLAKEVRSGDPSNIEGQAARIYWSDTLNEYPFGREPRSGSSINSMLDYGYGVLRGHGVRAVLSAGLNPALGVFHRGRSNPFNLVDDIIEPFRPAIDEVVFGLDREASLSDPEVKAQLVAASTQRFLRDGKTIPTVLEHFAQLIGQYFEGDIDKVSVPHWRGISAFGNYDG